MLLLASYVPWCCARRPSCSLVGLPTMLGRFYRRCQYWGTALKLVRTTELERRYHIFVVFRLVVVLLLARPAGGACRSNGRSSNQPAKQVNGKRVANA